jgi:hypothetical protein
MIRRISYRSAATAFVFTGLWFVLGLLLLWSPIPSALGIRGQMLVAWLLLFLMILAGSGAMLTLASINSIFPQSERPQPHRSATASRAAAVAGAMRTSDGKPLPWTQSPLPQRPLRRTTTATAAQGHTPEPPAQRGR